MDMGLFRFEKLSIERQSLNDKLRVISLVVFVFPFTIMFYILYQQGFFSSLELLHQLIFLFIALVRCWRSSGLLLDRIAKHSHRWCEL